MTGTPHSRIALLDLPQAVVLPGQYMVGVGLQGALVPDLRELVVAELAIGITDQVGHVGAVVMAERLQLLDGSRIIVAVIDRRIGCAISLRKYRIVDAGLLAALLLGLVGGGGLGVRRRWGRRGRHRISTATPAATSSRGKGRNDRWRRDQRHRKNCQRHQAGHCSDHVCLLLSYVAITPAAPCKPRFAQDIPEEISLLENARFDAAAGANQRAENGRAVSDRAITNGLIVRPRPARDVAGRGVLP